MPTYKIAPSTGFYAMMGNMYVVLRAEHVILGIDDVVTQRSQRPIPQWVQLLNLSFMGK